MHSPANDILPVLFKNYNSLMIIIILYLYGILIIENQVKK